MLGIFTTGHRVIAIVRTNAFVERARCHHEGFIGANGGARCAAGVAALCSMQPLDS